MIDLHSEDAETKERIPEAEGIPMIEEIEEARAKNVRKEISHGETE